MESRRITISTEQLKSAVEELKSGGSGSIKGTQFVIVETEKGEKFAFDSGKYIAKGALGTVYKGYKIAGDNSMQVDDMEAYAIKLLFPTQMIEEDHAWKASSGTPERVEEEFKAATDILNQSEVAAIKLAYDKEASVVRAPNEMIGVVSRFLPYPDLMRDPVVDAKSGALKILPPWEGLASLTYKNRIQLIKSLFTELEKFHDAHLVHGDIRASNIKVMQDTKGDLRAILLDFGNTLPCKPDQMIHFPSDAIGSAGCMMPEYFSDEGVQLGHKTDVRACLPLIYLILGEQDPWVKKKEAIDKTPGGKAKQSFGIKGLKGELDVPYVFDYKKCIPGSETESRLLIQQFQQQFFKRMERDDPYERPTSHEAAEFYAAIERLCDQTSELELARLAIIASGASPEVNTKMLESLPKDRIQAFIKLGRYEALEPAMMEFLLNHGSEQVSLLKSINEANNPASMAKLVSLICHRFEREGESAVSMPLSARPSSAAIKSPTSLQRMFSWPPREKTTQSDTKDLFGSSSVSPASTKKPGQGKK